LLLLTTALAIVFASKAFADAAFGGHAPRFGEPKFFNEAASLWIKSGERGRALINLSANSRDGSRQGSIRASATEAVDGAIQGWATDHRARAVANFVADDPSPNAPPSAGGDQASAEQAIRDGYVQKLAHCHATRNAVANLQSITWDPPGFSPVTGGSGTIHDADPRLGGQFLATPIAPGRWDIQYQWC
jgi:hypothetical protein